MDLKSKIKFDCKTLNVNFAGNYSFEAMNSLINNLLTEYSKNRCNFILADISKLSGDIPILDKYKFATVLSQKSHLKKMALIVNSTQIKPERFFEIASKNRGVNIKVFTNLSEADSWIKSE